MDADNIFPIVAVVCGLLAFIGGLLFGRFPIDYLGPLAMTLMWAGAIDLEEKW